MDAYFSINKRLNYFQLFKNIVGGIFRNLGKADIFGVNQNWRPEVLALNGAATCKVM